MKFTVTSPLAKLPPFGKAIPTVPSIMVMVEFLPSSAFPALSVA